MQKSRITDILSIQFDSRAHLRLVFYFCSSIPLHANNYLINNTALYFLEGKLHFFPLKLWVSNWSMLLQHVVSTYILILFFQECHSAATFFPSILTFFRRFWCPDQTLLLVFLFTGLNSVLQIMHSSALKCALSELPLAPLLQWTSREAFLL